MPHPDQLAIEAAGGLLAVHSLLIGELACRALNVWQWRVARLILNLSYGRRLPCVRVDPLDDLAEAMGTTRGNLHPVLRGLESWQILRHDERRGTYHVNPEPAQWLGRRLPEAGGGADDERARRAAAALRRLLPDNPLQPAQRELFEPETTEAEWAAEEARERAAQSPRSAPPIGRADHGLPVNNPRAGEARDPRHGTRGTAPCEQVGGVSF